MTAPGFDARAEAEEVITCCDPSMDGTMQMLIRHPGGLGLRPIARVYGARIEDVRQCVAAALTAAHAAGVTEGRATADDEIATLTTERDRLGTELRDAFVENDAMRAQLKRLAARLTEVERLLNGPEWALRVIDESLSPRDLERIAALEAVVAAAREINPANGYSFGEVQRFNDALAALDALNLPAAKKVALVEILVPAGKGGG